MNSVIDFLLMAQSHSQLLSVNVTNSAHSMCFISQTNEQAQFILSIKLNQKNHIAKSVKKYSKSDCTRLDMNDELSE